MTFFRHSTPTGDSATAVADAGELSHGDVSSSYARRLERAASRSHQGVLARQEIGTLPPIKDPVRRAACKASLALTAKTYFPAIFKKAWAQYHLDLIANFEEIIRGGGQRVVAIERGGGKTALCLVACLWALLNGYRKFGVFVGDTATLGKALQTKVIAIIRSSPTLLEDYPELIVFVRATDNRKKLRCEGRPIAFTLDNADGQTIFPDFIDCESCQAIISSTGMTGSGGRGFNFVNIKGEMIRPDLLLLDDCQNEESARSADQTLHREEMIENSFMGMSGGDVRIAAIMPITVRNNDCLASRYLNRQRHGDWHGMKYEAVPSMPTNMDLWDKFGESLRMGDTPDEGILLARQLFKNSMAEMLIGAVVSWPDNYPEGDLHPIEKYMRLYYLKPDYFTCEIQQQGMTQRKTEKLTRESLALRLSHVPRGVVPSGAAHLVAFVDCHSEVLYWMVMAIANDATSWIVDYGTFPEQNTRLFTLRGASMTMTRHFNGLPEDEQIIAAQLALDQYLLGRKWMRQDGYSMEISRVLKDSGWKTDVVHKSIGLSPWKEIIRPSRGWTVRAGRPRVHEWKVKNRLTDSHVGPDWIERYMSDNGLKRVHMDSNRWKSTLALQLTTTPGAVGSLLIYGDDVREHQLLFDHFLAEQRTPDKSAGEEIDIWMNPIAKPDNHWWDCAVGCCVAGSLLGALAAGQERHDVTVARREVEVPSWMLNGGRA